MKVAVVMGTQPEIIELAIVIENLGDNSYVIFSGQYRDYNLSIQFIGELKVKTSLFNEMYALFFIFFRLPFTNKRSAWLI